MKSQETSWSTYWSSKSPRMEFKIPSERLKGRQVLTVVLETKKGNYPYSISYNIVDDRGARGAAKKVVGHFEKTFFNGDRAFDYNQFNNLVGQITDWKMDIDKEFSPLKFIKHYWWDPFTDKLAETWVRIFNR